MKITRTSLDKLLEVDEYKAAHDGCEQCPCCGNQRISHRASKTYRRGLFRRRWMKIDRYKCYSCDAEWESEPYNAELDEDFRRPKKAREFDWLEISVIFISVMFVAVILLLLGVAIWDIIAEYAGG